MTGGDIKIRVSVDTTAFMEAIDDLNAALGRFSFAIEDNRISMGRLWLAIYLSKPWYRRLLIDIRRWFR